MLAATRRVLTPPCASSSSSSASSSAPPLYSSLVTRLLPAAQNDAPQAARELRWMVETLLSRRQNPAAHRFLRPHHHHHNNNNNSNKSTTPSVSFSLPSAAATAAALPTLTPTELARLSSWISRRVHTHTPLQYLLATLPFCNLDLRVRKPTLIPRWETEEWTTRLISIILKKHQQTKTTTAATRLRILDLCTGTGCIALALARGVPHAHVVAGDIHPRAVALARINARRNGLEERVMAQWVDVFDDGVMRHLVLQNHTDDDDDHDDNGKFDLVVANPPYVAPQDLAGLDPGVRMWEDVGALVAEDDGTEFHARIAACASEILVRKQQRQSSSSQPQEEEEGDAAGIRIPRLVMEIGETQGEKVKAIVAAQGFTDVVVWKDLAGVDRCVVGY
ncbi:hypothetical protein HDU86_000604 [Geranomyces michiganensis]|nr:hypothetical protein HDU86_000604 [Geranomyces michiganensis]